MLMGTCQMILMVFLRLNEQILESDQRLEVCSVKEERQEV